MKRVFPKLEQLCRLRGTYFAPVDLRWGITNKQAGSGEVVRLCLDFVERSAPYFLALLGDRYGSHIPPAGHDDLVGPGQSHGVETDSDWLVKGYAVAERSGYEWLSEEKYRHCSLTELEIELAAFRRQFPYIRFYFRQPSPVVDESAALEVESPFASRALCRLKGRVVDAGLSVRKFSTCAELADMVADDWRAIIDEVYPPLFDNALLGQAKDEEVETSSVPHQLFAEWAAHEAFAETRRRAFVATPHVAKVVSGLHGFVTSGVLERNSALDQSEEFASQRIAVVVGARGSGKTALLANWCQEVREDNPDVTVITHYVGSSATSDSPLGFMLHCIDELRAAFLDSTSERSEQREDRSDLVRVRAAFTASLSLGKSAVILDGLDEMALETGDDERDVLEWLPSCLPSESRLVISTSESHASYRALKLRSDTSFFDLPLLEDEAAKRSLVERHLAVHCKQLETEQMERVVRSPLASRPVFLASLANELRVFGIHEHVGERLDYYLKATSIGELWGLILRRWSLDYGWGKADTEETVTDSSASSQTRLFGWVADALRFIAVSRQGLTEAELLALLQQSGYQLSTLDWAAFRSAAGDALFERQGGLLNFLHQPLRNAALEHLLDVSDVEQSATNQLSRPNPALVEKSAWHGRIAGLLKSWPHSLRRTEELPWQCDMAGDMDGLLGCVSEPSVFLELADNNDQRSHGMLTLDLWNYWHRLAAAGHSQAKVYEEMLLTERKKLDASRKGDNLPTTYTDHMRFTLLAGAVGQLHASNGRFALSQEALNYALSEAQAVVALEKRGLRSRIAGNESPSPVRAGAVRSGSELLSTIQEQLANLHLYQLKVEDAEHWYRAALASASTTGKDAVTSMDKSQLQRRGRLLDSLGYLKAKDTSSLCNQSRRECVELLDEAGKCMAAAGSTPGQADVTFHLAVARLRQGHRRNAEEGLRKALDARRGWYGVDHPLVAEVMNELAGLLSKPQARPPPGAYAEAEKLYRRALVVRQRCLGDAHLLVATTMFHLGRLLGRSPVAGERQEAMDLLRKSHAIRVQHLGFNHGITEAVWRCLRDIEVRDQERKMRDSDARQHASSSHDDASTRRSWPSLGQDRAEQSRPRGGRRDDNDRSHERRRHDSSGDRHDDNERSHGRRRHDSSGSQDSRPHTGGRSRDGVEVHQRGWSDHRRQKFDRQPRRGGGNLSSEQPRQRTEERGSHQRRDTGNAMEAVTKERDRPTNEEDGWTTVSHKRRSTGGQQPRQGRRR